MNTSDDRYPNKLPLDALSLSGESEGAFTLDYNQSYSIPSESYANPYQP